MNKFRFLTLMLAMLVLGACGGGGGGGDDCEGGAIVGNCGGSGGTVPDDSAGTDIGAVAMGSGSVDNFSTGTIALGGAGVGQGGVSTLSAGGSVTLSVIFVVNDGSGTLTPFTDPTVVTFSSDCIQNGLALVNPGTTVDTTEGRASATYTAQGCNTGPGGEVITARANVGGTNLTAQATLVVEGADVGAIEFVEASPDFIGLRGTGGQGIPEQSTVRFRVVDETKGPVAGREVTFSLNTQVGGITFQPASAVTGADGTVQTVVQAGTVATSVRVTAVETESGISTQSSQLTISTGIPHQAAFSMSLGTCNVDSFNRDGVEVPVTVRLSDRFQNPVPDGTAVSFTTEGGQIDSSCATVDGECTVTWTSTDPRPSALLGDIGGQTGGRASIIATAIGEESFTDQDGDFVYDAGESFGDLGERFRDDNENGVFDVGTDGFFLDFNSSGTQDAADGTFNGLLCTSNCSANATLGISAQAILVMNTSGLNLVPDANPLNVGVEAFNSLTVNVTDLNGNYPPAGTVIAVTDIAGGEIIGPSSYVVADACGAAPQPFPATFTVKGGSDPASGVIFLKATTPSGIETLLAVSLTVS